jgi:hypothetical protein
VHNRPGPGSHRGRSATPPPPLNHVLAADSVLVPCSPAMRWTNAAKVVAVVRWGRAVRGPEEGRRGGGPVVGCGMEKIGGRLAWFLPCSRRS